MRGNCIIFAAAAVFCSLMITGDCSLLFQGVQNWVECAFLKLKYILALLLQYTYYLVSIHALFFQKLQHQHRSAESHIAFVHRISPFSVFVILMTLYLDYLSIVIIIPRQSKYVKPLKMNKTGIKIKAVKVVHPDTPGTCI